MVASHFNAQQNDAGELPTHLRVFWSFWRQGRTANLVLTLP